MSRRQAVIGLGGTLAAAHAGSALAGGRTARPRIGVGLYMLRALLAKDFDGTLAGVAAAGLKAVEFAGFYGRKPAELRAALAAHGLAGVGAHCLQPGMAADKAQAAMAFCAEAGLPFAIAPLPLIPALVLPVTSKAQVQQALRALGPDDFRRTADIFNRFGTEAKAAGVRFAYHTHGLDFLRFGDAHAFDLIAANTDPALVSFELDLGNMVAAGADPVPLIRQLGARLPLVHAKDWKPGFTPSPFDVPASAPIGEGGIDWKPIMAALGHSAVTDLLVEQEEGAEAELLAILRRNRAYLESL